MVELNGMWLTRLLYDALPEDWFVYQEVMCVDSNTFKTYNAGDMLHAIDRALGAYANKDDLALLRQRCMSEDFSWGRSANEYIRLYKSLLKG